MKHTLIGVLTAALLFAQTGFGYTARRVVCSQTGKVVKGTVLLQCEGR